MSFSVGGKKQAPSIILVGQRGFYPSMATGVLVCAPGSFPCPRNIHLRSDAGFKALSFILASDAAVP